MPARCQRRAASSAETGVSVVTPARNRAGLLQRAVLSALGQDGVQVEVIVVDDGSEPPLDAQLDASLRARIQILRNPTTRNAAYSRNRGAELARFPVLAFLDSDDVWRRDHLEIALAALDRHGAGHLYITPMRRHGSTEHVIRDAYAQRFGGGVDYRTSGFVSHRRVFDGIGGFDALLEKHQDWDFALRAASDYNLLLGAEATVFYDSSATGRMSGPPNFAASRRLLHKHRPRMRPTHLAYFLGGIVKAAALTRDPELLRQARALAQEHVEVGTLPAKARMALLCPPLFAGMTHVKRRAARLRQALRRA